MKRLALALLALASVASAAAIPSHAQAMQDQADENQAQQEAVNESANETVESGEADAEPSSRRGPPAFVQDLIPEHAQQNLPDFFW